MADVNKDDKRLTRGAIIVVLPQRPADSGFNARDRQSLDRWARRERRFSITTDEMGTFAMLYDATAPWASWGVVRQEREILLWNCVTLADVGRFATMDKALSAASGEVEAEAAPDISPANIIPFAAALARRRPLSAKVD